MLLIQTPITAIPIPQEDPLIPRGVIQQRMITGITGLKILPGNIRKEANRKLLQEAAPKKLKTQEK